MNVADAASYSSVLLLNLSDNLLEQSRNNPVVVQQEEMDRVGFEPTTSASLSKENRWETYCSNPISSTIFSSHS